MASSELMTPLTPLEERFEVIRTKLGLILAPLVFVGLLMCSFPSLDPAAHRLAAIMAAVVVLWITEALPMPVTALLGASACVILRVGTPKEVFAPFADQLMFLFIGSFILAQAIFVHGLDQRMAYGVLSLKWVGGRPGRLLFAFGACTAVLSAWMSNTATTAMMFTIGMSLIHFLKTNEQEGGSIFDRRYATGLMLITSFAASIGGLATPIGTPPNMIGLGMIRQQLDVEISFFEWSLIGVPIVCVLFLFLFVYLYLLCPLGTSEITGSHDMFTRHRDELGSWTRGQKSTAMAFAVTVALWVAPGFIAIIAGDESWLYKSYTASIPEAVAAIIGASLLFVLPGNSGRRAITWQEAVQIDWGVVLLYGGGFALGVLAKQTGLADAIGQGLTGWIPSTSSLALLVTSTLVAVMVSETTSNTASANIVVPVVIALAQAANVDPLEPALGATFGASLGFMLPVSTPCNAIVYGSGMVPLTRMIRYGLLLDIVGAGLVITMVRLLVPLIR